MAVLIAGATGNFTAAGTWRFISNISASQLFTGVTVQSVPTTPGTASDSNPWTGDPSTADGILLNLASRAVSPSGTITVVLRRTAPTATDLRTVTINVADLPAAGTGWVLFKFATSATLVSGDTHVVRVSTSVASQVSLFRDTAAGNSNWNRALRLIDPPPSVAAGDIFYVGGEFTGSGASTPLTVTVNSTAATAYAKIDVSAGGTLAFGVTASTAYILRTAGVLNVWGGGTLTMGIPGTPMPATSSAILEFPCSADGEFGLVVNNGGTFTARGATLSFDRTALASDAAAAATSLTTADPTGWVTGDVIAIATTSQTSGQSESRTLTSGSGTTLGVGALTNAHSGTAPTRAEIILLTRNVRIRAVTAGLVTYANFKATAVIDLAWMEFSELGAVTIGKRGVEIETTTGSCVIDRCSIHDADSQGLIFAGATCNNITLTNCVTYNLARTAAPGFQVPLTSGSAITITGNIFMQVDGSANRDNVVLLDLGLNFSNNVMIGGYRALSIGEAVGVTGTFAGNTIHSCANGGLYFSANVRNIAFTTTKVYRCAGGGITFAVLVERVTFDGVEAFGNAGANVSLGFAANSAAGKVTWINGVFNGDATHATASGILFGTSQNTIAAEWSFFNCTFGVAAGAGANARVAHSTADFNVVQESFIDAVLVNCLLASTAEVSGQASFCAGSAIRAQRLDQTNGKHKSWFSGGTVETEPATFRTAAPSAKLTPISASVKIDSEAKQVAVSNTFGVTPRAWVRKSAAYAGAQPRLRVRRNDAVGIVNDTTLATMTVGVDIWEELAGATAVVTDDAVLEFYVDADGTSGVVFVDDWTVS